MILNVAVVDDDCAVRDALATVLGSEGFEVRTYGGGEEFLSTTRQTKPDCLLLDVRMPMRSGLDVLVAVGGANYPAAIIMISGCNDIPVAVAAIKAGAHDFLAKPFGAESLVAMVREAVRVRRQRSASENSLQVKQRFVGIDTLTVREIDVLEQIAQGASNKEAGRQLRISPRTIEVHRSRLMRKLDARNTADLMRRVLLNERTAFHKRSSNPGRNIPS
jgi:two-component system, LuxR family, response regulator FixJ